jgi:hypothetical protein
MILVKTLGNAAATLEPTRRQKAVKNATVNVNNAMARMKISVFLAISTNSGFYINRSAYVLMDLSKLEVSAH